MYPNGSSNKLAYVNTYEQDVENLMHTELITHIGSSLGGTLSATQALLNGAIQDPELRRDLLGGMDHELRYLRFLYENWILMHTFQVGKMKLNLRKISPDEWLKTILVTWQKIAPEKRLQWNIHITENLPDITADPDRLAQAFGNLIYASIMSSPVATMITFEALLDGEEIKFNLSDAGPKINPLIILSEFPYLGNQNFENHPRLQKGLGLGIILAHRIILAHKGGMDLDDIEGFKNCISIRLPT
jgi:K+-sensing histidine kinase KdpD